MSQQQESHETVKDFPQNQKLLIGKAKGVGCRLPTAKRLM